MSHAIFPSPPLSTQPASNQGVLSAAANGLGAFITDFGGDLDRIFGRAGIQQEQLLHPTLSLCLSNYCEVLEESARQTGCDNFGLHYGQQFQPQALGLLGYVGLCSETLEDALVNFAQAFPFHQHSTAIQLLDEGECYRFHYQIRHGAIVQRRQDAELTMGMATNLLRHVLGNEWGPREVTFEHDHPEDGQVHRDLFQAPVHFSQTANSILIPKAEIAGKNMPGRDPVLLMLVNDAIRRLGASSGGDLLEHVRQAIHNSLDLGEPALDEIARQVNTSEWSLQRRLRDQGVSFSQLVDEVRREAALWHLRQERLSVSELALVLGYSETSAFSRAFRRWFGVSPRQWRTVPET
jgi:AraC-like DNA-binding protein